MEEVAWEGPRWLYAFLIGSCAVLLYTRSVLTSRVKKTTEKIFSSYYSPPALVKFQRKFLPVFFLFTLTERLQSVYGEALYENYGYGRQQIGYMLLTAHGSSLFLGTFLGVTADYIGRKRVCMICGLLQITGCLARHSSDFYVLCLANVCCGVAVSVFPSVFESWLIAEHDKSGFRQEWLSRTFWVMAFGMGVTTIGTGAFANWLIHHFQFGLVAPPVVAGAVAALCVFLIFSTWAENVGTAQGHLSKVLLNSCQAFTDKRVLLLGWAQACFDLSLSLFWFLWTPTLVADGRDIHSGVIYTYLMASLMLGSVIAALLLCGPLFVPPETFLPWIFVIASLCLAVPAYDYQEIGVLVATFCVFHVCVGIAWPCLARLRNIYIQNDRRAGVLSLFRVPVNIGVLFILIKGGLMRQLENSKIYYMCSFGLLSGAATLHILNKQR